MGRLSTSPHSLLSNVNARILDLRLYKSIPWSFVLKRLYEKVAFGLAQKWFDQFLRQSLEFQKLGPWAFSASSMRDLSLCLTLPVLRLYPQTASRLPACLIDDNQCRSAHDCACGAIAGTILCLVSKVKIQKKSETQYFRLPSPRTQRADWRMSRDCGALLMTMIRRIPSCSYASYMSVSSLWTWNGS